MPPQPFPFELPPAVPGFEIPLRPETIDQINLEYLGSLLSYVRRLNLFLSSGHTQASATTMAQVELHRSNRPANSVVDQPSAETPDDSNYSLRELNRTMQEGFKSINATLNTLAADGRTLKADVNTLKNDMNTLKADVNTLKGDMNTLKGDVNTLKGDVNTLKDDGVANKAQLGTLATDVQKLKTDMGTLTTTANQLSANTKRHDAALAHLGTKIDDLARTEEFKQAITQAVSNNATVKDIQQNVTELTNTLNHVEETATSNSEKLSHVQNCLARVDRVQCQTYNAAHLDELWVPTPNDEGLIPSDVDLQGIRSRDHLNELGNRELAELVWFYGLAPPKFYTADDRKTARANFVRQSRSLTDRQKSVYLEGLRDTLTVPAKSFAPLLPETP
ncbi:hypothetical protein FRC11_008747 [Ceratobasidium sp. 423]|nr:hypothetical protein FRC11_008747 [Ceratobasidium sp. 423]